MYLWIEIKETKIYPEMLIYHDRMMHQKIKINLRDGSLFAYRRKVENLLIMNATMKQTLIRPDNFTHQGSGWERVNLIGHTCPCLFLNSFTPRLAKTMQPLYYFTV